MSGVRPLTRQERDAHLHELRQQRQQALWLAEALTHHIHQLDQQHALDTAWRCLADSCVEGDRAHEQRALVELHRLIPEPRQGQRERA